MKNEKQSPMFIPDSRLEACTFFDILDHVRPTHFTMIWQDFFYWFKLQQNSIVCQTTKYFVFVLKLLKVFNL